MVLGTHPTQGVIYTLHVPQSHKVLAVPTVTIYTGQASLTVRVLGAGLGLT